MINKNDILKLQTRRKIYDCIKKNPGLHFSEISRKLDVPKTTLIYHLKYLEKLEIVISKTEQGYKRYYIKQTVGAKDKEILNILRQEIPLRIVLLLLTPGPADIFKNKETYEKLIETYEAWERTYSKRELIEFTKYWGGGTYVFHIHKHRTTVSFHIDNLCCRIRFFQSDKVYAGTNGFVGRPCYFVGVVLVIALGSGEYKIRPYGDIGNQPTVDV